MKIQELLQERQLPNILTLADGRNVDTSELWEKRRLEIIDLLSREEYGYSPQPPFSVRYEIIRFDNNAFAGKAEDTLLKLIVETKKGEFSFPVHKFVPKRTEEKKIPLFLHINFRPDVPDLYMPVEEILDNGFAVMSFCYQDITEDKEDGFHSGIADLYPRNKKDSLSWGKIAMWAWAASRVIDYVETLSVINKQKIAVVGHSRLGKTALWCGAQDKRITYVFANNAGCSGDALTRGKKGEHIQEITRNFPFWFCETYPQYAEKEEKMPFDQHFLLAAIAPRKVCVGAALEDEWADPVSQYLSCVAASEVYERLGIKGFLAPDRLPESGDSFHEGNIGYHLRSGEHYFSRDDWKQYMEFMK